MLEPTEEYARFDNFRNANFESKRIASELREDTAVVRDGQQWVVLIPPGGTHELSRTRASTDAFDLAEKDREETGMSKEDFLGEQNAWAASREDGWYYED